MFYEIAVGGIILGCLILYALTGGADFGGGVLDLFARFGRDANKSDSFLRLKRRFIAQTIAPIWEANHIWLIVVIVLLFAGFPLAFSALMTALHIPFTIMLIGIVLRGSAFIFRAYGIQSDATTVLWGRIFAISSLITPFMLGVSLGAVVSEGIRVNNATGTPLGDYYHSWFAPFPIAIGLLTVTMFSFLAAVYLAVEADSPEFQESFRRDGLVSAVALGIFAGLSLLFAINGAPNLFAGLLADWWSIPFQIVTGLTAIATIWLLWRRSYQWARLLAIIQVSLIIIGLGLAQYPYLIPPDLTFHQAAAPPTVLRPLFWTSLFGLAVVAPSFWLLYRIFTRLPDLPQRQLSR